MSRVSNLSCGSNSFNSLSFQCVLQWLSNLKVSMWWRLHVANIVAILKVFYDQSRAGFHSLNRMHQNLCLWWIWKTNSDWSNNPFPQNNIKDENQKWDRALRIEQRVAIYLSIYIFIHIFIYLSIFLPTYISIHIYIYLYIYLSTCILCVSMIYRLLWRYRYNLSYLCSVDNQNVWEISFTVHTYTDR